MKNTLVTDMGQKADAITVLRNGVDLEKFKPRNRTEVQKKLGITRPTLLSAGYLIDRKGHDLVIKAMADIPYMNLLIAGSGPNADALQGLIDSLHLGERVRLIGELPHEELIDYYSACEALILASSREGWANVLLEAMACGAPVIATNVWGTPEVVGSPDAGLLLAERSVQAIVDGVGKLMASPPDRAATRRYAEGFSWDKTTRGQIELFTEVCRAWKTG